MFEKALALAPDHAPTYYFFGTFMQRQRDETTRAIAIFQDGLKRAPDSVALKRSLAQSELFAGHYDEARRILNGMSAELGVMPERQRRIMADVYAQSYAREMARECDNENFHRALTALRGLKKVYEEQTWWLDLIAREKMATYGTKVESIALALKSTPDEKEATELAGWFRDTFVVGPVAPTEFDNEPRLIGEVRSKLDGGYGFLFVPGRVDKMFFYRGSFINKADFDRLDVGDEVSFQIGENYKGPTATKLMIHRHKRL